LLGLLALNLVSIADGQEKLRTVQDLPLHSNSPIIVVSRELGDKLFDSGSRVLGRRDWLKQLRFGVKNISNKDIVYFNIDLSIPKQGSLPGSIGLPIYFGSRTAPAERHSGPVLHPGDRANVAVSDDEISYWDKELRKYGVEDFELVTLDIRTVHFADGTGWQMGIELQQDPSDPKKWLPSTESKASKYAFSSEWLAMFVPIPLTSFFGQYVALSIPASGRNFFVAPKPMPVPTCGYWRGNENWSVCIGCTAPEELIVCDQLPSDYLYESAPGTYGYLEASHMDRCRPNPAVTPPPTCNSCPSYYRSYFREDSCQPGGCNQPAIFGCQSGFVDIGGVCKRSQAYIDECPQGYNSSTCSCNPPCHAPSCHNPPTSCPNQNAYCDCEYCGGVWSEFFCSCDYFSPVILDILGNGISLTSAANGVSFDLKAYGVPEQLGWTAGNSDDAWLVFDRNGNGLIDNGEELFGNFTPQPAPPAGEEKNGFLALAEYDRPANGGDSDGKITNADAIFTDLRLWQDINHNGVSEAGELHTLPELGLATLDMGYKESRRTDEFGNRFRYRAKVKDVHGAQLGRWAWDVFLVSSQ